MTLPNHIEIINTNNPTYADYARGYWIANTAWTDDTNPAEWTFNSGELKNDHITGPFKTEEEAINHYHTLTNDSE